MEPTDEASVSNRFDAFLGELDGLTPTTEKQIEKRLRELRNVKRGKPARKPTKKRQQRNRTNKLAQPLKRLVHRRDIGLLVSLLREEELALLAKIVVIGPIELDDLRIGLAVDAGVD